jgi:tetratricopeptide (TPR) repeat protein
MNDAGRNLTLAGQLADQGDPDASQDTAAQASAQLDSAVQLLQNVITNPAAPPSIIYLSHSQLAAIDITRTRWPDVDVAALMADAEQELHTAIAGEIEARQSIPDALPYYNMGLVQIKFADLLRKSLPKTAATTRPATAEELKVIDRLEAARDFLKTAMDAADAARQHMTAHIEAEQLLGLSSFERGNADFVLGGLAESRGDEPASEQYAKDAIFDYNVSLGIEVSNVEAQYRIGLCYERFGDYVNAEAHLLSAAVYSPQGRYAPTYNEIGWIICRSTPTDMSQLRLAIQCFRDALSIDPNYTDAQDNLKKALTMLAGAKLSTEPSTQADVLLRSTVPTTQPSTPQ